ncbi:phosphomevalonate kinase [Acidianus ambivalens]|uniref:phosphomevalonate kinase n=1 Tax=Acidianus ambivalens TaxID=2283 RepID=A0A650CU81_ACIAM|nr:phosphomevalonate kinase [Acidianus ambivalens]MQL55474.1 GHMP kinase [Acidianus ambivalens]QGR21007.1 GHMP kinase [Acidianus ambivalens]
MISAPGKVLWIGSYAVVFGGLSHVIAINKRVKCEATPSDKLIFETTYGTFYEKGNELIESVVNVIKNHLGDIPRLKIRLFNDEDFQINGKKTGLGSSSAATVALTACLYNQIKGRIDTDEIHLLAQEANFIRQKGIGSGFDIAAAVYGSIIYKRFTDLNKRDWKIERLRLGNKYEMLLGFTGRSSETVNLVKMFIEKKDDEKFIEFLREINIENDTAIKLLKLGKVDEASQHAKLARDLLNVLAEDVIGVKLQSEKDKELIKIAEDNGAYISLLPGAGGGDVIFALGENLDEVRKKWKEKGLKLIEIKEDDGLNET